MPDLPHVRTQSVPLLDTRRLSGYPDGAGSCCQPVWVWWNIGLLFAPRKFIHLIPARKVATRTTSTINGVASTRFIDVFSGLGSDRLVCIWWQSRYSDLSDERPRF